MQIMGHQLYKTREKNASLTKASEKGKLARSEEKTFFFGVPVDFQGKNPDTVAVPVPVGADFDQYTKTKRLRENAR